MVDRYSLLQKFFQQHQNILAAHYPGIKLQRIWQEIQDLSLGPDFNFPDYLAQLLKGRPLEHLAGLAWFYHSSFLVNPQVLIPRKETELLVAMAAKHLLQKSSTFSSAAPLKIWEVGTGCGAIIISLLQDLPFSCQAWASDLDPAALQLAQQNFFRLQFTIHPQTQIQWLLMDRLAQASSQYHLIISNPPYLKTVGDRVRVHPQVLAYEPALALFLPDDEYLSWYQLFFQQVSSCLLPEGVFFCEGDELHLAALVPLAHQAGLQKVTLLRDYHGCHRYLFACK